PPLPGPHLVPYTTLFRSLTYHQHGHRRLAQHSLCRGTEEGASNGPVPGRPHDDQVGSTLFRDLADRSRRRCREKMIANLAASSEDRKSTRLNSSHVKISY